jgi:hypothetical protein
MNRLSTTTRVVILVVIAFVALGASAFAVLRDRDRADVSSLPKGNSAAAPAEEVRADDLLFTSTNLDRDFGRLAVVPSADPTAPRALSALKCDRVDFEGGRGLCLTQHSEGLLASTVGIVFDRRFHELHTVQLAGYSSRVRVAPDGRYGATTTFVNGDSYADAGFSTRTSIIDLRKGDVLFDLEKLDVTKDGEHFTGVDFNFWGVTFASNGHTFYATLGTGGETYLIRGDVLTRRATVLRSGIECPSLSPDGTRIVYKARNGGATITWHLAVLDLATMQDHRLDESQNVDDQAEWLDDDTVAYGLPKDPDQVGSLESATPGVPIAGRASVQTDVWKVPADGSGQPEKLLDGAWSTVVPRG